MFFCFKLLENENNMIREDSGLINDCLSLSPEKSSIWSLHYVGANLNENKGSPHHKQYWHIVKPRFSKLFYSKTNTLRRLHFKLSYKMVLSFFYIKSHWILYFSKFLQFFSQKMHAICWLIIWLFHLTLIMGFKPNFFNKVYLIGINRFVVILTFEMIFCSFNNYHNICEL